MLPGLRIEKVADQQLFYDIELALEAAAGFAVSGSKWYGGIADAYGF
jgi:hypothetical protein